jgi:hypothetical protein
MTKYAISIFMMAIFTGAAISGEKTNDLEPEEGMFTFGTLDPYYLALRDALLGEHKYRLCQLTVIPSFEPEWTVYLIKDEAGRVQAVYKVMKENLWYQMTDKMFQDSANHSIDISGPAQAAILSKINKDSERAIAPISSTVATLLEQAWMEMLARVQYPKSDGSNGLDGITYHVLHWDRGIGLRSGTTYSPDKGSNTGALVEIAEDLRNYVINQSKGRPALETTMIEKAKALLVKLGKNINAKPIIYK